MSSENIVLLVLLIGLIIYVIYLFYAYNNKTFIFAPYKQPELPNSFHPNGEVIPLTPEQIATRNAAYTRSPP